MHEVQVETKINKSDIIEILLSDKKDALEASVLKAKQAFPKGIKEYEKSRDQGLAKLAETALTEVYGKQFVATLKKAGVDTFMVEYNRVDYIKFFDNDLLDDARVPLEVTEVRVAKSKRKYDYIAFDVTKSKSVKAFEKENKVLIRTQGKLGLKYAEACEALHFFNANAKRMKVSVLKDMIAKASNGEQILGALKSMTVNMDKQLLPGAKS